MTSSKQSRAETLVGFEVLHRDDLEIWQISRPHRLNSISFPLAKAMTVAAAKLQRRLKSKAGKKPKALLLQAKEIDTKRGNRIWIAGGDLQNLASLTKTQAAEYAQCMSQVCYFLEQLAIPVVATIGGGAIGGGAEFALAADVRIGCSSSYFEFKQLKIGLTTGFGGGLRLQSLLGRALSQKLLYGQLRIGGEECFRLGLLTHYCGTHINEEDVSTILHDILTVDSKVFAAQKTMIATTTFTSKHRTKELQLFSKLWRNAQHAAVLKQWEA